jgi:hypothetical protein
MGISKRFSWIVVVTLWLVAVSTASAGIISTASTTVWPNADNQDHVVGWAFAVIGSVSVNFLGFNYFNVPLNAAHVVGIYDSGGTLLASTTITNASLAHNGYLWNPLVGTLVLGTGVYVIAATTLGLNDGWIYEATGITTSPGVFYLSSWYTSGTGGTLVAPAFEGIDREYLAPNFAETIPEPAAIWLAGAGLAGVLIGVARRGHAARRPGR